MPIDLCSETVFSFSMPSGRSSADSMITYCAMISSTMPQCRIFAATP